jgi:hypothetical protein
MLKLTTPPFLIEVRAPCHESDRLCIFVSILVLFLRYFDFIFELFADSVIFFAFLI